MVEDRGSLDLTFQIESKDKEIADLKHDNKSLAKQVDDKTEEIKALKMKLEMLDNKSWKWYNNIMNSILSIINSNDVFSHSVIILLIGIFFLFIKNNIINILSGISKKTKTEIDDIIIYSLNNS